METPLHIIYSPTIHVMSVPKFLEPFGAPKVNWIANEHAAATDAEKLIEYAGRGCYLSYHNPAKKTTDQYLVNILEQAHGSVLEHANISLLVEGISRSCSHEWVRHRAGWAYSQLSQRYVDESQAAFVIPPAIIGDANLEALWKADMKDVLAEYIYLVDKLYNEKYVHIADKTHRRKVAREAARSVLPNATETKMVATANIRAWRHFLKMRTSEFADQEIRRLAVRILQVLTPLAPTLFKDFELYIPADGMPAAKAKYQD